MLRKLLWECPGPMPGLGAGLIVLVAMAAFTFAFNATIRGQGGILVYILWGLMAILILIGGITVGLDDKPLPPSPTNSHNRNNTPEYP